VGIVEELVEIWLNEVCDTSPSPPPPNTMSRQQQQQQGEASPAPAPRQTREEQLLAMIATLQ